MTPGQMRSSLIFNSNNFKSSVITLPNKYLPSIRAAVLYNHFGNHKVISDCFNVMTSSVPDWLDRPLEIQNGRILESDLPFYTLDLENIYLLSPNDDFYIQKAQKECLKLIKSGSKIIGLDCEWDWFNQKQVNLIQISSSEGNLLLHNFPRLPPAFLKILESEDIKKVGVNVQMDLDKIGNGFAHSKSTLALTPLVVTTASKSKPI